MFSKKTRLYFKFGLPFMVLMVGSAAGILQFSKVRYKYRKAELLRPSDLEKMGIKFDRKDPDTVMEEEYEKIKNSDLDNWENIRGPRPWEKPSEALKEQQRQRKLKAEQTMQN